MSVARRLQLPFLCSRRRTIMRARTRNWIGHTAVVLSVFILTACGNSSSSSPSAPSGQPGSTGATINGLLTASTGLSATNRFAALTGSSVTVTVAGTNLTAIVDSAGHFTLSGVPSGDVRLRFSGPGTDAPLTVTGVQDGDKIQITISLAGNTASIENALREGMERRVEVEGRITSVSCPSFKVNGVTVMTNASTQFVNGSCATLKIDTKV